MNKAIFIRHLEGWAGDARLYELIPPLMHDSRHYSFVIVSAMRDGYSGEETFIFAAKKNGQAASYAELPGSYYGGCDHEKALSNAGYTVVQETT